MAFRTAALKTSSSGLMTVLRRWAHAAAQPAPMNSLIAPPIPSPTFVLPEHDQQTPNNDIGFGSQSSVPVLSMELMAVPKKKVLENFLIVRFWCKGLLRIWAIQFVALQCESFNRSSYVIISEFLLWCSFLLSLLHLLPCSNNVVVNVQIQCAVKVNFLSLLM